MSEPQPPQIPPVEQPKQSIDESLERLEENTLDKQARSAAYRAVVEHNQHVAALNNRIDVLQEKLDHREEELQRLLPRVAELEQANRGKRVLTAIEVVGTGGGAILLGVSAFTGDVSLKIGLFGAGVTAASIGVFAKLLFELTGWPK